MEQYNFPVVTFILATLMLSAFLFTYSRLDYYEERFGFIPSKITPYSLLTYTFLHVDLFHLMMNLAFLFIAGLTIEEKIGGWKFLAIYAISALFAVLYDLLNRRMFGISSSVPFIGASGAVFGLLAASNIVNPFSRVPVGIIFALLVPYMSLLPIGVFSEPIFVIFITVALIIITTYAIPIYLPLFMSMLIFMTSWIVSLIIQHPIDISSLGHLGGSIGGILSFFLLALKSNSYKQGSK